MLLRLSCRLSRNGRKAEPLHLATELVEVNTIGLLLYVGSIPVLLFVPVFPAARRRWRWPR